MESWLLENPELLLEGKYINDAFWTGLCDGTAAVEKRSTKAVWSIGNEYRMAGRMHDAAPDVVARPLAWKVSADGKAASVATERVEGASLTDLLARGLAEKEADSFASDIETLAKALMQTGIVHRDLFSDNLLLGRDGHLKAIDWQLAIDRSDYREDPWVEKHWKFRYVVFGVNRELGLGVWNDFHALGKILAAFPQTAKVKEVAAFLSKGSPEMTFASPPDAQTRLKLRLYAVSLRLQMVLKGRRHRKYPQLERRYRTITGKI
ncbi:MAG: hypothetical protein K6F50_01200 [Kiritimatiellae bacterium]|nr:hypothetical protein [Kiritimatiellia bacterium]